MSQERPGVSRRDFARTVAGVASAGWLARGERARAGDRDDGLLGRFCRALDADRRRAIVLPADDPRRMMVQNDWAVVPPAIASLTADQQDLALGLVRQVCTEAGFARLSRQREDDAAGWKHDHLAVFGTPNGPGPFEWVLSGRHLTLRGSAGGLIPPGPLFWGHADAGPAGIASDQAEAAAALFQALDLDHRRRLSDGIDLGELAGEPLRAARRLAASPGELFRGFEAPANAEDLAGCRWQGFWIDDAPADAPPPAWRLTGPGFAWSFHGRPHVHCWFETT